jgi:hypothetical protein
VHYFKTATRTKAAAQSTKQQKNEKMLHKKSM